MERTIDILFIIGLLVHLFKGADLLLRPHQERWLQEKCDTLALWLDFTRPLKWYAKFKIRKTRVILIIGSAVLYLSLAAGLASRNWDPYTQYNLIMIIVFTVYIAREFLDSGKSEHPVIKFLLSGQGFLIFLLRPILLLAVGAFIIFAYLVVVAALFYCFVTNQLVLFIIILYGALTVLGILITYNVPLVQIEMLAVLSLCILCLSAILLVAEAFLLVFRGIAWRIAEYNKGAFAAIVLIATILLGATEFYLKTKNQPPSVAPVTAPSQIPQQ